MDHDSGFVVCRKQDRLPSMPAPVEVTAALAFVLCIDCRLHVVDAKCVCRPAVREIQTSVEVALLWERGLH